MVAESGPQTLSATALVHEAWLRMGAPAAPDSAWKNRRHFFGSAAQAMRRILIDRARNKGRQKRGGEMERVDEAISQIIAPVPDDQLLALNDALEVLALKDPEIAEIVNLHYFGGLSWVEIAEVTGNSERDLHRQWTFARAWLREEIAGSAPGRSREKNLQLFCRIGSGTEPVRMWRGVFRAPHELQIQTTPL